jgi:hypothetical protein
MKPHRRQKSESLDGKKEDFQRSTAICKYEEYVSLLSHIELQKFY